MGALSAGGVTHGNASRQGRLTQSVVEQQKLQRAVCGRSSKIPPPSVLSFVRSACLLSFPGTAVDVHNRH